MKQVYHYSIISDASTLEMLKLKNFGLEWQVLVILCYDWISPAEVEIRREICVRWKIFLSNSEVFI